MVQSLTDAVGRTANMADLQRLGEAIPALVAARQHTTLETTLGSAFPEGQ